MTRCNSVLNVLCKCFRITTYHWTWPIVSSTRFRDWSSSVWPLTRERHTIGCPWDDRKCLPKFLKRVLTVHFQKNNNNASEVSLYITPLLLVGPFFRRPTGPWTRRQPSTRYYFCAIPKYTLHRIPLPFFQMRHLQGMDAQLMMYLGMGLCTEVDISMYRRLIWQHGCHVLVVQG